MPTGPGLTEQSARSTTLRSAQTSEHYRKGFRDPNLGVSIPFAPEASSFDWRGSQALAGASVKSRPFSNFLKQLGRRAIMSKDQLSDVIFLLVNPIHTDDITEVG